MTPKVLVPIVLVILAATGAVVFYFTGMNNGLVDDNVSNGSGDVLQGVLVESESDIAKLEEGSEIKKVGSTGSESTGVLDVLMGSDVNINGDLNIKINLPADDIYEDRSMDIDLKGLKLYSENNSLQSQIGLDKLNVESTRGEEIDEKFFLNGLDLVYDNENVYLKFEGGSKEIIDEISREIDEDIFGDLFTSLLSGSYLHINNADYYKKLFPEISNNPTGELLITAFSTRNPFAYLQQNGFGENALEKFLVKGGYEYLFDVVSETEGEKILKLSNSICNIYKITPETSWEYDNCIDSIEGFNVISKGQIKLTQDGEYETISYKGFFAFNFTYGKGEVKEFLFEQTMIGSISLKDNILDINIDPQILKMSGIEFTAIGKVDFNDKASGNIDLVLVSPESNGQLSIELNDGNLKSMKGSFDLVQEYSSVIANIVYENEIFDFSFENKVSGFIEMENSVVIKYTDGKINILANIMGNELKASSTYMDNKNILLVSLKVQEQEVANLKSELTLIDGFPDSMKIQGFLIDINSYESTPPKYKLSGVLKDGQLKLGIKEDGQKDMIYSLQGKLYKDNIQLVSNAIDSFITSINLKTTESDNKLNLIGNIQQKGNFMSYYQSEDELPVILNVDLNGEFETGKLIYSIPKNYKTVDVYEEMKRIEEIERKKYESYDYDMYGTGWEGELDSDY